MNSRRRFLTAACALPLSRSFGDPTTSTTPRCAAATSHPLATNAAHDAIAAGGNAVDGAIAAALVLGVADAHNSGLGGGMFFLIRSPDGKTFALDGRESAPAAASRNMFLRNGKAVPDLSRHGPLAIAVPSQLATLAAAASRCGRLPLSHALNAAATIADKGFIPDRTALARINSVRDLMPQFPELAAQFGPAKPDTVLRQPDLANSLRAIAANGPDWFYRGPFAQKLDAWMQANGGILSAADMAAYSPVWRDPISSSYRGRTILGFPPPSSGGIHIAQMLGILENFPIQSLSESDRAHVLAEVMKLAFADRAHWLGDPDHAPVPRSLTDLAYLNQLASSIRMDKAATVPQHGTPPRFDSDIFRRHTTHFSVCDHEGWWVAATATINTTFGSKVIIPGTGIVLNNEMDDFSAQPGAPNAFGLIGTEANAVAPHKRPLSSMSPTIVLKDNLPVSSLGAAGGPTIISQTLLHLVRLLDLNQSPTTALASPRLHHQWRPDSLVIEPDFPKDIADNLARRGHSIQSTPRFGVAQIISRLPNASLAAAADPRASGSSKTW